MTQGLRELDSLPENLGTIPISHVVTHSHLQLQFQRIQCPLLVSIGTACTWCINMYVSKTLIYKNKMRGWKRNMRYLCKDRSTYDYQCPRKNTRQLEEINQMRVGSKNVCWRRYRICNLKTKKTKENRKWTSWILKQQKELKKQISWND